MRWTPYLEELRDNWRAVSAAFVGLAASLTMTMYVVGIMAPYLIAEFKWPRSEFSMLVGLGLVSVFAFPIVGRITDAVGVRKTVLVGIIACPLIFLGLSQLQDMRTYAFLFAMQCLLMVTTAPPVYCRVVVQHVERARGLALAIVASGSALAVAIGGPLLNDFVADHGWRAGYVALAIFTAVIGVAVMALLPKEVKEHKEVKSASQKKAQKPYSYAKIFRSPAFWILVAGNVLTTPPQAIMATQLSLVLAENGAIGKAASAMIGCFAGGLLVGRFIGGFALDRFPAQIVAAVGFTLSAVGLFLFASHWDARLILMLAALLFGLTSGAENDVVAYLIVRNFGVGVYSSVHGIMAATTGIGSVLGIILNTVLLAQFDNFTPFLVVAGVLSIIGGFLFLLLPRDPAPLTSEDDIPARGDDPVELPARA